jgi:thiol-disulfide isomerase/thioredoxin
MTRVWAGLALCASSALATSAPSAAPPVTTTTADVSDVSFVPITDQDYRLVVLEPRRGKVVLVNFWASYCLPCLEEIPALLALRKALADDVEIVFVSTDDPAVLPKAQRTLRRSNLQMGSSYFVANDDPTPFLAVVDRSWGGAIPHTIVYGRDGAVWQTLVGGQESASFADTLRAAVAASPRAPRSPAAPHAPASPTTPTPARPPATPHPASTP